MGLGQKVPTKGRPVGGGRGALSRSTRRPVRTNTNRARVPAHETANRSRLDDPEVFTPRPTDEGRDPLAHELGVALCWDNKEDARRAAAIMQAMDGVV